MSRRDAVTGGSPRVVLVIENIAFARDHRLRKQASALVAAGARVSVVCRRDPGNSTAVPGVRVLDYRAPREGPRKVDFVLEYGYSVLMAAWALLRLFVTDGFDVVQVSSTPDIYFVLSYPYRLLGRGVVFDFKDLSPETYEARYSTTDSAFHRLLLAMERASLRAADHVLVVNGSLHDIARDRGGVAPERITVVGNGPGLERLSPRTPAAAPPPDRPRTAIWVGFISPQDHLDLAVRAMEHLVRVIGRTDCRLLVIGVGDARADLENLVRELGLEAHVSFAGWVDPTEVAAHLAAADIGVEPGIEDFVSPVKALEFMAAGLPFVAFDVRETRALGAGAAVYAERGSFCEMARLMDGLLSDDGVRSTMGQVGRERIRTALAWEHQAERYVKVMQTVSGRRTRRPDARRPDARRPEARREGSR